LPSRVARLPEALWYTATALAILAMLDYIRLGNRFLSTNAAEGKVHGKGE
jgi:hypothetical protein